MAKRALPKTEEKRLAFQASLRKAIKSSKNEFDYKAYCSFHPSTVLQGGYQFEYRIIEDFKRFDARQLVHPRHRLPAKTNDGIGFDTEYDSSSRLLTVGVASCREAQAIETTEAGWQKKVAPIIKKAKVLCGHSVAGDMDYLVKLGLAKNTWLRGTDVHDSLLLARMYDENRGKGSYGLETLLLSEMNFEPWKAATEKLIKATGNAADWSVEQRVDRCRIDAWATAVLAEHFMEKLNGTGNNGDGRD